MKPNIRLINARIKKDLKQWQVAHAIGIHESDYSRIERGRKKVSKEIQLKIAGRLGVDPKTIFNNQKL